MTWRAILVGRRPRRTLVRVGVLLLVSFVALKWALLPVRAYGVSMAPTYRPGSLHLVDRLAYGFRDPSRGDVVAVRLAGTSVVYVKRILALPGERLAIRAGVVHVDGRPLDEPYVRERAAWELPETTLAADEYFVAGDNRAMRIEQHDLGKVRRERIVGRVLF
ncbi:MAG TPA: signal peptidase I [Vicinamibacterales bacterium]|nr:signal peptidase I [Vicinamibacterales bacterium]